ncbi:MAG: hypothetical protein JXB05_12740 [Myxococcaceae bacterium]|nr:hypothetical protein [Myxococcaceae bacterium]
MVTEAQKPKKKKPYRKPAVRSEKILVVNFFSTGGQPCDPFCDGLPPMPDA